MLDEQGSSKSSRRDQKRQGKCGQGNQGEKDTRRSINWKRGSRDSDGDGTMGKAVGYARRDFPSRGVIRNPHGGGT